MKVIFRVDSSTQIGSGHLMRCLTLAGQLQKKYGAEVGFISRDLSGNLHALIREQGYKLFVLPRAAEDKSLTGYAAWLTVPQVVDADDTVHILQRMDKPDLLVIDSYAIDSVWEKKLRPYVEKIMVIDDLANRPHDCDILLDQNFYLDKEHRYDGLVPVDCRLKLGPEHALLREEFYDARKHLRQRDGSIRNILVFYGGSDLTNETMKALQAIVKLQRSDIQVNVIVGSSNPHKAEVKAFCQQYSFLQYYCQVDNIAEFMNEADLSLGAGGTTTWERCFLGLPAIVTAVAENQVRICEDCAKAGLIKYVGSSKLVTVQDIMSAVEIAAKGQRLQFMQKECILDVKAE
jgi:UDP-2,4-diacetamido-2,4,6-trideoxy-beta-L-altropyranose hydrolase